jgi:hypothetical protein
MKNEAIHFKNKYNTTNQIINNNFKLELKIKEFYDSNVEKYSIFYRINSKYDIKYLFGYILFIYL